MEQLAHDRDQGLERPFAGGHELLVGKNREGRRRAPDERFLGSGKINKQELRALAEERIEKAS